MAHDDEHPARSGAPGVGAGPAAPSHPLTIALAELQSELDRPDDRPFVGASAPPDRTIGSGETGPQAPPSAAVEAEPRSPHDRMDSLSTPERAPAAEGPSIAVRLAGAAVVSLIFSVLGAWAYESLFGRPARPDDAAGATPAAARALPEADVPPGPDRAAALDARIDRLAERVDLLAEGLDAVPRPEPAPDLDALRRRQDELDEVVAALGRMDQGGERVEVRSAAPHETSKDALPDAMEGEARGETKVETTAGPATSARPAAPAISPAVEGRDVSGPVLLDVVGDDEMLDRGVDLFKKGRYKEADEVFRGLERAGTDDARFWYYAALSRGFAAGRWGGEAARLAEKGAERERAGTPAAPRIDAAFRDLTTATGKDWLAFYRGRVAAK